MTTGAVPRELAAFLNTLGATVLEVAAGGGDVPLAPVPALLRPLVSIVALQRLVAELADLQSGTQPIPAVRPSHGPPPLPRQAVTGTHAPGRQAITAFRPGAN